MVIIEMILVTYWNQTLSILQIIDMVIIIDLMARLRQIVWKVINLLLGVPFHHEDLLVYCQHHLHHQRLVQQESLQMMQIIIMYVFLQTNGNVSLCQIFRQSINYDYIL